ANSAASPRRPSRRRSASAAATSSPSRWATRSSPTSISPSRRRCWASSRSRSCGPTSRRSTGSHHDPRRSHRGADRGAHRPRDGGLPAADRAAEDPDRRDVRGAAHPPGREGRRMSTELSTIPVPGADAALAATLIDGKPFAALRPMCEALGIDYSRQFTKLKAKSWATTVMKPTVAADGKPREMVMIDRRTMTRWLATIEESRVAESARPTIRAFRAQAADALDAYFHEGGVINP